jgi:hypothetical protein
MTSNRRLIVTSEEALARMFRAIVAESITYGAEKARTPTVLSGTAEFVNVEELDVVHVRMDEEAIGDDLTQSENFEDPGVIPTTRLGETYTEDVTRVSFDGPAGASSIRTSAENQIVLPYGSEAGQRIILDGNTGTIQLIDEGDNVIGYIDPTRWFIGIEGSARAILDPLSGLRLRDQDDALRVQLSPSEGLVVREPTQGISGVTVSHDGIVVLDPATGERISITSGTTSAIPTPHWTGTHALSPGTGHATPAATAFGADDIDVRFVTASAPSDLGAQSYTPPTNWTERTDVVSSGSGVTLAASMATRDPATQPPSSATFTSTSSGFTREVGQTVIVAGGGATSPSFRASATATPVVSTARAVSFTINYPPGVVTGDLLLVGVSIASSQVPVGWIVPPGWKQLGVVAEGVGTSHVLGAGVWYNTAPAVIPASETVTINMAASGGVTKVQAHAVAIADPYGYPGGLDIRRNNVSMPRGAVKSSIETFNTPVLTTVNFPYVVNAITGVQHLAGRKYKVEFYCPSIVFASTNANSQWRIAIQRNTGGGNADVQVLTRRQMTGTGVEELPLYGFLEYVPATDVTADWRIQITNLVTGAYNIQLLGASIAPRFLAITDIGGEF